MPDLSVVEKPLSRRAGDFWKWFVANEKLLSDMIISELPDKSGDFVSFVQKGTGLISGEINFNSGGDYEFTFSAEGWPDLFIIYPYIISCMPESLKAKWTFHPFNQGSDTAFDFRIYDADINTADILVRVSYLEASRSFHISYYEPALDALPEEESDNAFWVILENTLGEGVSFEYVEDVEQAENREEGMIRLPDLREYIRKKIEALGLTFFDNPKDIYSTYKLNPQESGEPRFDIIVGSTCLYSIVADYYDESTEIFDHIDSFGARALYLSFHRSGDIDGSGMLELRHDIEDRISGEILEPMNLGQVIGGATGMRDSYIDLIVFDTEAFVKSLRPLLNRYPEYSFYLSDFRRHAPQIQLV